MATSLMAMEALQVQLLFYNGTVLTRFALTEPANDCNLCRKLVHGCILKSLEKCLWLPLSCPQRITDLM